MMERDDITSKPPSLAEIRKELDARRSRVKEEFENKIQEAQEKAEQYRKRVDAHKKKRDAKIARIEKDFGMRADTALKKLLGKEDYMRLHEWLLKKKKEETRKLDEKNQPTEKEDYERQTLEQTAQSRETAPEDLVLYYYKNKDRLAKELEKDIGLAV